MNSLHLIPMPKPIKLGKPKIASVHIQRIGGGFKVQHNMTHGPRPVPFVFSDPGKMVSHLKRIQSSQWRQPDRNEAHQIVKTLDIQE
jgi:hypothetical protein